MLLAWKKITFEKYLYKYLEHRITDIPSIHEQQANCKCLHNFITIAYI